MCQLPAYKHIAQKPLLDSKAEIPVPRLWVSGISVKVQKVPFELLGFFLVPFLKKMTNPVGLNAVWGRHLEQKISSRTGKAVKAKAN